MGILLFLSSGLFLGWSLGANDAANVFGTAVGTRMVRFKSAAVICAVFVILGATISGAGAAHTLGRLGAVNTLAGAFTVALSAALTTFWMTRLKMPVSTSQAIVGAILGWNFYSSSVTDVSSLTQIVTTWVACPLLSGVIAFLLFVIIRRLIHSAKIHLLRLDAWTRWGMLAVGAFGSYSLGANNIANVMGVFVPDNPFPDITFLGVTISGVRQLFFLGSVAIAVGVFTYSERVMRTVGSGLVRLSPISALVVVLAHSITLFLFASEGLEHFLASHGLPTIPLVPVSSSQAVVGAIIGISLYRDVKQIRFRVLGEISLGWVATPILAGVLSLLLLSVVDNVFDQAVSRTVSYRVDERVLGELQRYGVEDVNLAGWGDRVFSNPMLLKREVEGSTALHGDDVSLVLELSQLGTWYVDPGIVARDVDARWLTPDQMRALRDLSGRSFDHKWLLYSALARNSTEWRLLPEAPRNRMANQELEQKLDYLDRILQVAD
jgi:inorganic phosphate transporter, PiT family